MIAQARSAGVMLLVGHAHGYDLPIQRMREIIASGELGRVRMIHTWNFTDWVYRPRRPDELLLDAGGGVTFRQGLASVRHRSPARRRGGPQRPSDDFRLGSHSEARSARTRSSCNLPTAPPRLQCTTATGIFPQWSFAAISPNGAFSSRRISASRRRAPVPAEARRQELAAKRSRAKTAIPERAPYQPAFGLTIVSCERGDIRQSPRGLYVYTANGREEIVLPTDKNPRDLVLDELHGAMSGGRIPVHDGAWGLANLEICLAALKSSETGSEIELEHQVPVPSQRP